MTATIIVGMLCAYLMCFSVMFLLISRRLTGSRMGMDIFAIGHLLLSGAYILQLMEIGTALGHTLTLAAPLTYYIGSMRFFGRKARFWKPVLWFALGYSALQGLVFGIGGPLAQFLLLSGSATLIFLTMSVIGAYGIRSFAKDIALEMLLFVLLLGGFCILNGIKFFKLLHGGMEALDMGTSFQTIFYIYMMSMATVLPPTMIWLVLRRLTDELRSMAARDPLTKLLNRRGLTDALTVHFGVRSAGPAHLLMIDIDHFKQINDCHGHKVGDLVLCHVAEILQKNARQGDLICRMGGEEFLAVCLDTGETTALQVAERVRRAIEESPLSISAQGGHIRCTVTIGVSYSFTSTQELDISMQQADAGLYKGKSAGRNRVERIDPSQPWVHHTASAQTVAAACN